MLTGQADVRSALCPLVVTGVNAFTETMGGLGRLVFVRDPAQHPAARQPIEGYTRALPAKGHWGRRIDYEYKEKRGTGN